MIIDCHGHYTTAPKALQAYRDAQIAALEESVARPRPKASSPSPTIEIRESLESAQLKLQRERGTDVTIFSPRASAMAHHIGDETTSLHWSQHCNDLIHRVCALYPEQLRRRLPAAAVAGRAAGELRSASSSAASTSSGSSAAT